MIPTAGSEYRPARVRDVRRSRTAESRNPRLVIVDLELAVVTEPPAHQRVAFDQYRVAVGTRSHLLVSSLSVGPSSVVRFRPGGLGRGDRESAGVHDESDTSHQQRAAAVGERIPVALGRDRFFFEAAVSLEYVQDRIESGGKGLIWWITDEERRHREENGDR